MLWVAVAEPEIVPAADGALAMLTVMALLAAEVQAPLELINCAV